MDVGDAERPIIRVKDLVEYKQDPKVDDEEEPEQDETLYKPYDYKTKPTPGAWRST